MNFLQLQLKEKEMLTPKLGIFHFVCKTPLDYLPGQYLTLGIKRAGLTGKGVMAQGEKGMVMRPYSLSSAPHEGFLEMVVTWILKDGRRDDGRGQLTTELFEPAEDAEFVTMDKARGAFLEPADDRQLIMVGTGTGIGPYISILRNALKTGSSKRYVLIHGVAKAEDLAYRRELEDMKEKLDLRYYFTTSREETSGRLGAYVEEPFFKRQEGKSGRVNEEEVKAATSSESYGFPLAEVLGTSLTPEDSAIMLCGNPGMVVNISALANHAGFVLKKDLIVEQYWN